MITRMLGRSGWVVLTIGIVVSFGLTEVVIAKSISHSTATPDAVEKAGKETAKRPEAAPPAPLAATPAEPSSKKEKDEKPAPRSETPAPSAPAAASPVTHEPQTRGPEPERPSPPSETPRPEPPVRETRDAPPLRDVAPEPQPAPPVMREPEPEPEPESQPEPEPTPSTRFDGSPRAGQSNDRVPATRAPEETPPVITPRAGQTSDRVPVSRAPEETPPDISPRPRPGPSRLPVEPLPEETPPATTPGMGRTVDPVPVTRNPEELPPVVHPIMRDPIGRMPPTRLPREIEPVITPRERNRRHPFPPKLPSGWRRPIPVQLPPGEYVWGCVIVEYGDLECGGGSPEGIPTLELMEDVSADESTRYSVQYYFGPGLARIRYPGGEVILDEAADMLAFYDAESTEWSFESLDEWTAYVDSLARYARAGVEPRWPRYEHSMGTMLISGFGCERRHLSMTRKAPDLPVESLEHDVWITHQLRTTRDIYATYRLALRILDSQWLDIPVNRPPGILMRTRLVRRVDGGEPDGIEEIEDATAQSVRHLLVAPEFFWVPESASLQPAAALEAR